MNIEQKQTLEAETAKMWAELKEKKQALAVEQAREAQSDAAAATPGSAGEEQARMPPTTPRFLVQVARRLICENVSS